MKPPLTVIQKIKALNDKLDVCLNSFEFGSSNLFTAVNWLGSGVLSVLKITEV